MHSKIFTLGRGLIADTDVLLLDEPTLGMASLISVVNDVLQKLGDISSRLSTTILVASVTSKACCGDEVWSTLLSAFALSGINDNL